MHHFFCNRMVLSLIFCPLILLPSVRFIAFAEIFFGGKIMYLVMD